MKIDDVITETILAIYQDPALAKVLFLKGGSAMRIFDNLTSRLSIDADFSIKDSIEKDSIVKFFSAIKTSVEKRFWKLHFEVIDFKWGTKPKLKKDKPEWWGGWSCEFKLVSFEHRGLSDVKKQKNALIPEGANSSKIVLDISEHEYCGKGRSKTIRTIKILGYSRELLVVEKIRAICQQHPDYAYRLSKNRARDFYDIYELTRHMDDDFPRRCSELIDNVFKAKDVSLQFLGAFWNDDFIDEQRRGFDQVKDTVRDRLQEFDVYVENLRFFVGEIAQYNSTIPLNDHKSLTQKKTGSRKTP